MRVKIASLAVLAAVLMATAAAGPAGAAARNIESVVRKRNGRWIALEVERSGRVADDRGRDDSRGDH